MKHSYSLFELNEYIRRVIALNFNEAIWIHCEISQIKEVRGNVYMDLVEHDDNGDIQAQLSAAIWYKSYLFIKNKLGPLASTLLTAGTQVLLKVNVDFNEKYGLKLVVEDIDPSYTIGKLEMARQQILERLKSEGVVGLNSMVPLPSIVQRVAVISSQTAAGYQDFVNHLFANKYGYSYNVTLFPAAMQGQNTEREVCAALDTINSKRDQYDIICIIRGGGAKLDLSFFDNFNIGYKIATSPLPVITGIGHDIDLSVADMMAYTYVKTPTAVADWLIEHHLQYESDIIHYGQRIIEICNYRLKQEEIKIADIIQQLEGIPRGRINSSNQELQYLFQLVNLEVKQRINYGMKDLASLDQILSSLDPANILNKGYMALYQEGQQINAAAQALSGPATLHANDGKISIHID